MSDHMPVYICKKAQRHKHPKITVQGRNYRHYTVEMFGNVLLDNSLWIDFWKVYRNPDRSWDIFRRILTDSVNRLCP